MTALYFMWLLPPNGAPVPEWMLYAVIACYAFAAICAISSNNAP